MQPVLGLMSGTSLDGIDASFVFTDGNLLKRTEINSITPYSGETLRLIKKIIENPKKYLQNKELINLLSQKITLEHGLASIRLIKKHKVRPKLVGFHGQTIFHDPYNKKSIQLGDGFLLSKILKTDLVFQFRKNDLLNGGQGAPLAPIYHKTLLDQLKIQLPAVVINIGGITNITYYDGKEIIGFDTGPGNNLMDFFMQNKFNKPYDNNGQLSSKGSPNLNLIKKFCDNKYFNKKPPKSLDRKELIENYYYKEISILDPQDSMATLCSLTVETIKNSFKHLPKEIKTSIVVGGGQNNNFLMNCIKKTLSNKVYSCNELNLPGDFIESELIAFLAARKLYNLPSTFLSTTGASRDTVNGEIIYFKS